MTQYLLSVQHTDADYAAMDDIPQAEIEQMYATVGAFNERLQEAGAWVFAGGLMPPSSATGVDNTGDAPVLHDGPYAESKEHMGGLWIIEAPDLDAALEWAKAGSKACGARVVVRPFQG